MSLFTMPTRQRRILALWFPRLPADRLARAERITRPLVIAARAKNALFIHALCARAAALGLYRGQPLANARAMVEGLCVRPANEKAEQALLEQIADWCDRFTPMVGISAPDTGLLDITGASHLFGGEKALLAESMARLAHQGFTVAGAVAGSGLAARALACHASGTVTAREEEAAALAPLPVSALSDDRTILTALRRAGLLTIGQVQTRGRSELTARLGEDFVARLDILAGAEEGPLNPRRILPDITAERRFPDPVTAQDFIDSVLHGLAQTLCESLERQGRGARLLEAAFFRADGAVRRLSIKTGTPSRDANFLMRLLRQKLDALADPLDPGFGFDLIRLEATLAEAAPPTALSFESEAEAEAGIGFLIDRLAARFGETRVQRFVPQDTHVPEAAAVAVPAQEHDFDRSWRRRGMDADPPRRPIRFFERPEAADAVAAVPDGPPLRFRWRRTLHDVVHAEGPERIALPWWRGPKPTRDYFRVETREGLRFWLYRDGLYRAEGLAPRWYVHGIFA